jgi:hypothetical protein
MAEKALEKEEVADSGRTERVGLLLETEQPPASVMEWM